MSDKGALSQFLGGSQDKAGHLPAVAVRALLNDLAVGWVEGNLFHRWICSGWGMRFFPETQVLGFKPYLVSMSLGSFGRRSLAGFLLLAAAVSSSAALQLSREQGDRLARKIDGINRNAASEPARSKPTPMSELEVNSYLAFNIKDKIPRGLANPEIRIVGDGQLAGRVFVDMDEFKRHRSSAGFLDPLGYISGQVPLTARGVLRTRDGKGQFQLASAEIHGVPVPKPIVQELVSFFSRTPENPSGFNLDAPFNLPAKIREVAVNQREAVIVQ